MLKLYRRGGKFAIFFLREGDQVPVQDFLDTLKNGGKTQKEDFVTLSEQRFKRTADHGPPYNKEQCKELDDGIFEFKAGNGSRVLWFYDKNSVIICSHGFQRPSNSTNKAYGPEIKAAKAARKRYLVWKAAFEAQKQASLQPKAPQPKRKK